MNREILLTAKDIAHDPALRHALGEPGCDELQKWIEQFASQQTNAATAPLHEELKEWKEFSNLDCDALRERRILLEECQKKLDIVTQQRNEAVTIGGAALNMVETLVSELAPDSSSKVLIEQFKIRLSRLIG